MDQSSLDRIFAHMGLPGWDKIYPNEICKKCYKHAECEIAGMVCAAITVIGGLAVLVSIPPLEGIRAEYFLGDLKKVLSDD